MEELVIKQMTEYIDVKLEFWVKKMNEDEDRSNYGFTLQDRSDAIKALNSLRSFINQH